MAAEHRIKRKFRELRARGAAARVPFIVAGDPDMDTTRKLVLELEARGADLIELGVPFSDPMADGPANQRASARGLGAGASLAAILSMVSDLRAQTQIPLVLFGYYNPIFHYGCERLCADAARAGIDGLLVLDLPPEESGEMKKPGRANGLDLIYVLARPALLDCLTAVPASAQPRDRAIVQRLSLLCVADWRDRRAGASRHRHRRAYARHSQRDRPAYRRRLRYLDARASRRGCDDGGCGRSRQCDFVADRGACEIGRRADGGGRAGRCDERCDEVGAVNRSRAGTGEFRWLSANRRRV